MGPTTTRVLLPAELVAQLREKPRDEGGYQTLIAEIAARLKGSEIEVDAELRERIEHYAYDYGSGGWQNLLREVVDRIELAERSS